jgi:hypothetical protein
MTVEAFGWVWLPALVGVALLAGALRRVAGPRPPISRAVSVVVLTLSGTALWILWRIAAGAWPTALPHLFLGVALGFVLLEHWLVDRWQPIGSGR